MHMHSVQLHVAHVWECQGHNLGTSNRKLGRSYMQYDMMNPAEFGSEAPKDGGEWLIKIFAVEVQM